ncbi:MAG: DUF1684 domain-containing protein [Nonlabens sp.]
MKNIVYLFSILLSATAVAQHTAADFTRYKDSINNVYKNGNASPLTPVDKDLFKELNFYPYNPEFVVEARFEKIQNPDEIVLKTTTTRRPVYSRYGYLHFKLKGAPQKLVVLKDASTKPGDEYHNYLSLYFTDATSGNETYGVGRYMGLWAPLGEKVTLDFNTTYNPYCAYSYRYSCPIPPAENYLDIKVEAGIKKGFVKE